MSARGSRILFASYALRGHINKCIVLAAELAARGHAVFFATQAEGRAWLPHPAVQHVAWEPRAGFVEHLRAVRGAMSEAVDEYRRIALSWDAAADDYAPTFDSLEAVLASVAPDLLIVPQVLGPAIDLAGTRALPLVILASHLPASVRRHPVAGTPRARRRWASIGGYVSQRRARRRLERVRRSRARCPSLDELFRRTPIVATSDRSIEPGEPFTPNVRLVGPLIPDPLPAAPAGTQQWLEERGPAGIVLAAFGTLVRLSERQVAALAEGLADCGAPVLWALPERHHALVRSRSAAFRAETFVPQATILAQPAVRAFVTHAGANSAIEAMYWGRPILALPFMFDQHHYARRAVDLSVGLALDPHALTGADVRRAVRRVLDEQAFADAAGRLGAALRRTPGVKGAADIVEAELAGLQHAR